MGNRYYPYQMIPLIWDGSAMPNFISPVNLSIHYDIVYKQYIDSLNQYAICHSSKPDLYRLVTTHPGELSNLAVQVLNHEFFWKCIIPYPTTPSEDVQYLIHKNFGSKENMQDQFSCQMVNYFATGWVWLVYSSTSDKLLIINGSSTYHPFSESYIPLFCLEVWEHSIT